MKKFFSIVLLCVLFSSVAFAQNWYGGVSYGQDINLQNGDNINHTINVNIGYFFDDYQAVEFDYSHGFKGDFGYYNRIGTNYVFEFTVDDEVTAPYIKLGAAYKNIGYSSYHYCYHEDLADFKLGLGIHCYPTTKVSINIGVDLTNSFNDNICFKWKNTLMQINVGFAYYI